jgi:hypothetical protein
MKPVSELLDAILSAIKLLTEEQRRWLLDKLLATTVPPLGTTTSTIDPATGGYSKGPYPMSNHTKWTM